MARPSRVKSSPKAKFAVYEDSNIPTPDSSRQPKHDHDGHVERRPEWIVSEHVQDKRQLEDISEDITPYSIIGEPTDTEVDDENDNEEDEEDRRESTVTRRTSISSLPESSVFDTDYESNMPAMHQPYTPPSMRPTFRRPESVRRMQLMASPTPYERTSPRRSALHAKSRTGTPQSFKQSPRPRPTRYQEEDNAEEEKKEYPLVLLHMTLLPVELRWSSESMFEILPPHVIENLQLLRSKVSETILNRGILVPHPRGEYELLEERLLEALELRNERVTKCGHFRARDSTSSSSSGEGSIRSADSGVALSLNGEAVEQCTTCNSPIKATATAVDVGGRKWSIKVFAANGLMRASAWTAAWTEMESVDVEILPWISPSLGKRLDAMAEREEQDERRQQENDETRIKAVVEEQVRIAHEERKRMDDDERAMRTQSEAAPPRVQPRAVQKIVSRRSDLPQVYRAADIPLSMLLRNYFFLLAQDKRNIAMFALAMLAIWMSLRAAVLPPPMLDLVALPSVCEQVLPEPASFGLSNATSMAANHESPAEVVSDHNLVNKVMESVPAVEKLMHPATQNTGEDASSSASPEALMHSMERPIPIEESANMMPATVKEDLHICDNPSVASDIFTFDVCTYGGR